MDVVLFNGIGLQDVPGYEGPCGLVCYLYW